MGDEHVEPGCFYRVRNWEKFQVPPRASGWKPPWCKLYHGSLNEYDYVALNLAERGLLMEFYKLATRFENQIPTDSVYLMRTLHLEDVDELENGLNKLMSTRFLQRVDNVDIEVEVEVDSSYVREELELATRGSKGRGAWWRR